MIVDRLFSGVNASVINFVTNEANPIIKRYSKVVKSPEAVVGVGLIFWGVAGFFALPCLPLIIAGGLLGGAKAYEDNCRFELAGKMKNILNRSLGLLNVDVRYPERDNLENEFLEKVTRSGLDFNSFNEFYEFQHFSFGDLAVPMRLIYWMALASIQGEKRSALTTGESLEGMIAYAENYNPNSNGNELIFLSRYYLGKCYGEQGEVEKARNQYNIVFNGTQNNALKEVIALARV